MDEYVYITNKGEKYHTDNECRHLFGKTYKKILLSEAERKGKELCKTCYFSNISNNFYIFNFTNIPS